MAHLKFNPDARFPTKAQRKALLRRDRVPAGGGCCCRTPGCTNHFFLEIHHIIRYSQGGKTLPRSLVTLCSRCHKNTEEGKLLIQLTESGELVFTDRWQRSRRSAASGKGHLVRLLVGLAREGDGFALGSGDGFLQGGLATIYAKWRVALAI